MSQIFNNHVLWVAILAWSVAQVLKVIGHVIKYKTIDFSRFIGSGGMPSSHSAFVCSLATGVGQIEGYSSTMFAISVAFALVVMYDASGVRRAAGKQAAVLNKIMKNFYDPQFHIEEKLKELIGHTPVEVFAGAILGVAITLLAM